METSRRERFLTYETAEALTRGLKVAFQLRQGQVNAHAAAVAAQYAAPHEEEKLKRYAAEVMDESVRGVRTTFPDEEKTPAVLAALKAHALGAPNMLLHLAGNGAAEEALTRQLLSACSRWDVNGNAVRTVTEWVAAGVPPEGAVLAGVALHFLEDPEAGGRGVETDEVEAEKYTSFLEAAARTGLAHAGPGRLIAAMLSSREIPADALEVHYRLVLDGTTPKRAAELTSALSRRGTE